MHSKPLALCLKNPMLPEPLIMWRYKGKCHCEWGVKQYRRFNKTEIVSYDFSCILEALRIRKLKRLPKVIDIRTAKKLSVGKPRSEFKTGNEPWQIVKILKAYITSDSRKWLNSFTKLESLDEPPLEIARDIMEGLAIAWSAIEDELKAKDEARRFYDIEVPIYNIFLQTELNGIHIDRPHLTEVLKDLKLRRFRSYKKLELEYGFVTQQISTHMKFSDIENYVQSPCEEVDFENDFWRQVDLLAEYDDFSHNLETAYSCRVDSNSLLRYSVDTCDRVYPTFDVMGTVTGRILMPTPGIQYLKKTSRKIFCPAKGKIFLYADFDQFEPGIVASLSADPRLTEIYNAGDVYEKLSEVLFNDAAERKVAKTIFLAFLYGMSKERLISLVTKISKRKAATDQVQRFFTQFKQLNNWKESLCETAKKNGFAESAFGNRRYLSDSDSLSAKEKRWIPNQRIQGTASQIFKRSLIALHDNMKSRVSFLIPMHDAILLEVSDADEEETRSMVVKIFCEEFACVCPEIVPSVSFEKFAPT